MTEWTVRRWARFGNERLYAETPGGTALGYLDLRTGVLHANDESDLPLLRAAIEEHRASEARKRQPGEPVSAAPAIAPTLPREGDDADPPSALSAAVVPLATPPAAGDWPESRKTWVDLSRTRAGAAARERALAEREAQGWFRHGVARLIGARTDERAWRIGADGEEAVAHQLANLGEAWKVIHAVPVGDRGADIDHVVIGPAGVFTLNTKNHPRATVWVGGNTVMINGHRVPYVRNSRHEARRASALLSAQAGRRVAVQGVVVVMGVSDLAIKAQPEDGCVVVVSRRRVRDYLTRLQARLDPVAVNALYELARRSTTWRP